MVSAYFCLFRDIKISFGAFASTDSFVDVFSALPHGVESNATIKSVE